MEESKPSYFAITPAEVRYCNKITPNAKLLYGEITALCNKEGYCWASNKYFADLYEKRVETISVWIRSLKENGFIKYEVESNYKRKIFLTGVLEKSKGGIRKNIRGVLEKSKGGVLEKSKYNNINNNSKKIVNKNPLKAEYQKNSENKEKSEIQNNSVSKIAMSSVEKNYIEKTVKKLDIKQIEFFKVYQNQFKFTCSEKTKAVIEGVPRIMNLYNKYYGKNYLSKFKQSVVDIASDKYWQKVFSDNPLRVAPKNFFNQTFVENYLIGRVNKIKKNQNGQLHKTVLSEERRKQIDADNNRELSKLG
ncbi:MAG: helix-turn-helix domain-containing protein [Candidatus Lokiarchaeota archaeon]|nr:helix-turn-helix domain-containing protein [Candidatus Lokiarchaeota archaeon]